MRSPSARGVAEEAPFNPGKFIPRARNLASFLRELDGQGPLPCKSSANPLDKCGCTAGVATLPGGLPIFRNNRLAGGIGVVTTTADAFRDDLGLVASRRANRDNPFGIRKEVDPSLDIISDMKSFFERSLDRARRAGIPDRHIILDPGIGFSKRTEHSLAAVAGLPRLAALGYPLMIGVSRKRLIGEITGVSEPRERVMGTVGLHVAALARGARIFRVHDVREHRQALDAAWAVFGIRDSGFGIRGQ